MGWLPSSRLYSPSNSNSSQTFEFDLVSLSHPEILGYLAGKIGDAYIEFRINERWDAGIRRPKVLIHILSGVNSVAMASDPKNWVNEWQPGQVFGPSEQELAIRGGIRIIIESFDLQAKKARILVQQSAKRLDRVGPGLTLGGVTSGGDGLIILPSGKIIRFPPNSPLLTLLYNISMIAEAETYHAQN